MVGHLRLDWASSDESELDLASSTNVTALWAWPGWYMGLLDSGILGVDRAPLQPSCRLLHEIWASWA